MYYEVMDSIQITARVPRELVERLDRFAGRTHRSRAGSIELLLEKGLEFLDRYAPETTQAAEEQQS
jgi:predicted DNA-binding protein